MIQRYVYILRRWLWLVVLTTVMAGTTTFIIIQRSPTLFEARTSLLFGPATTSPTLTLNDFRTVGQLLEIYAALITKRPVLQEIIAEYDLAETSASSLESKIQIVNSATTQIMTIKVTDDNPEEAKKTANAIAQKLISLSPTGESGSESELQLQIREQVGRIEQSIVQSQRLIDELQANLDDALTEEERIDILNRISDEQRVISDAARSQATLSTMLFNPTINQVKIIEPAVKANAIDKQLKPKVMLSAVAGLVLGLAIVLAVEFTGDTLQTPQNLVQATGTTLLGTIAKPVLRGTGTLVVRAHPESRTAENYRMVGTKLLLSNKERGLRSLLISSSSEKDDIGEITANLAVVMAQLGKKVILVDANLRAPALHEYFGLADQPGLSDILSGGTRSLRLMPVSWLPNLLVLPAGTQSSHSFEILASGKMGGLIKHLQSQGDIVVIAASPLLAYADSLVLASQVDGTVVVAFSGSTHRKEIAETVDNLRALGVHVIGTMMVINNFEQWIKRPSKKQPASQIPTEKRRPAELARPTWTEEETNRVGQETS